uniref:Maestro heat-like repeat family member 1 n=1 Tax=Electrophorus electricus TaxID=8005 RepID=A0A4W4GLS8_ELEEL
MVTCFEQNLKRNLYIIEVQILHRQKGTLHCHTHALSLSYWKVTLALLDAANDKDPGVQEQVRKSILTLGNHQPDKVLSMCQDYLVKHSKLVSGHRVVVLQTIELVVKSKIDDISSPKIKSIITLASDEMTRSKEIIPDWQQTASNILVAVGNKYINDFMEEILSKFQPGVLPHFYVVETLASLSDSNVYGMVPFLNAILGTMLPMLSMAKQDNMKLVFSSALSHFSESILEYLANLDKAPDPTVRRDTFSGEIYTAYDVLFSSWLQSRDPKLRLTVAEALGAMSHLIAQDKLEEQLPRLLPALLSLYKKNPENYIISKSLCQVLDAAVNMGSRVLETQIDGLLTALHQQVTELSPLSHPTRPASLRHILCLSVLGTANAFPDRLMVFVLQRLENSNERSRIGSLTVLRHLINSTSSIMETKKLLVLASIKQPLADHSNKVKQRVVQVISAMAHHGYLELEGGEVLVRFIIQHCSLPDSQHVCSLLPAPPASVTASMCDNTLHLFATTVGRLTDVLWPMLLGFLTPAQYSNATAPLCKSLILLASKKRAAQEPGFIIDLSMPVLLQVNACFPFRCRGHGAPSLSLLNAISPSIHPKVQALWETEVPHLLTCLEGQWPTITLGCAQGPAEGMRMSLFLYKCIGVTLQQCTNKELVRKQLQEILISARHNDATERAGVAMGVGLCARSHLDDTLAKLEEFGKSDAFKKASGIFGLLKDKNDVDVEKMKSTMILCYGHVALHAPEEQLLLRLDTHILRSINKHFNTKVRGTGGLAASGLARLAPAGSGPPLIISSAVLQALYADTFWALHELLRSVLARDLSPDGLHAIFTVSSRPHSRPRPRGLISYGITQHECLCITDQNLVTFHNLGALLGRLAPRCTDPSPAVRTAAVDCIYTLLHIQLRYEGFASDYRDDSVETLLTMREKLSDPDPSVLYKTCSDLTKIISKRLPHQQLNTLIFMLFEGLVDSQSNCSRASSVILNTLLRNRGAGLQDLVPEMLEALHVRLQVISEEQVKVAVAQSILILASQHLQTVINTLLSHPLPWDSWSCEMWIALGADSAVARQIMEMIMEKLNIMVPFEDKKQSMLRPGMTKVATSQPLAMTCALRELMLNGQAEEATVTLFPRLFSALLVRVGSSVAVQLPKDISSNGIGNERRASGKRVFLFPSVAVEALRILLARAHLDAVVKALDEDAAWDKMKGSQQHTAGVTRLSRAMAKHAGPRLPAILESLCPSFNNIYECQRITVTAFCSELLNHHVVTELMMIDMLMNSMMERISDPCSTVRMLAVRGLGNVAVGSPEKVNKYAKELLAAMSSGMEEKDDPGKLITLEAMSGLSKVLLYLDQQNMHLLNDKLRCASIMLLGNLSRFGSGEAVFKDQIHNVLVSLLMHLNDPNAQVVKACKYTMRVCAPVVGSEQITAMFHNHLHEEKGLHYGEFINDLIKYIIQDFPGMLNFYHVTVVQFFKSNWSEIRASAAMFIGEKI